MVLSSTLRNVNYLKGKSGCSHVGCLGTSEGVQIDPKDIEAVQHLRDREPKNVGDVRALLGFLGYYRTFIQDHSRIARPMFQFSSVQKVLQSLSRKPPQLD